jgi:hypothetical protein
MGASGWHYFTPFQEDIGQALEDLRQRVFESGEYGKRRDVSRMSVKNLAAQPPATRLAYLKSQEALEAGSAHLPEPQTIEEALEQAAESGTHSILDVSEGLSDGPDFGTAFPMPDHVKLDLYGAIRPTGEQVEAKLMEPSDELGRGQCWYVIVYKDGVPSEIYFAGCSGD